MATVQVPEEQRVRLSCIPWETYVMYSDGLGPRHIRVTYNQGEMEIMTLSSKHENRKKRLARLVEALTEEVDLAVASFGSMTCRRESMMRGLEPDEVYWIQNEPAVRDREDIDLETDPPPDLALEVEVSRGTLDRLAIYAALRVPEVWRWNGEDLIVCLLTSEGSYRVSQRSEAFPFLSLDVFQQFLTKTGISETQLIREFRAWVREQKTAGWNILSKE